MIANNNDAKVLCFKKSKIEIKYKNYICYNTCYDHGEM